MNMIKKKNRNRVELNSERVDYFLGSNELTIEYYLQNKSLIRGSIIANSMRIIAHCVYYTVDPFSYVSQT